METSNKITSPSIDDGSTIDTVELRYEKFFGKPVIETILYEKEPKASWDKDSFKSFLIWATVEQKVSDITLLASDVFWIKKAGTWYKASRRKVTSNEIFMLLDFISNNNTASASLKSDGTDLDFAYELKLDDPTKRGKRLRFRGNAVGMADGYSTGGAIVLRTIPAVPPSLSDYDVEDDLLKYVCPKSGLVLITGVMGSGKSTLLAAILHEIAKVGGRHLKTFEAPIEFSLSNIPEKRGPICQSQVPNHVTDFLSGVRNSTRTAPDVILIGESRDPETLRGMIESAEIGVAAYSTVHTQSVPDTLSRIINVFKEEEQRQIAATLLSCLRLIVQQRLIKTVKGKLVAVREFLAFDSNIKSELFKCPIDQLPQVCERLLFTYGQPLQVATHRLFLNGIISKTLYDGIMFERKNCYVNENNEVEYGVKINSNEPRI